MSIHDLPDDVAAFLSAIARGDAWAEMEDDAAELLGKHKRDRNSAAISDSAHIELIALVDRLARALASRPARYELDRPNQLWLCRDCRATTDKRPSSILHKSECVSEWAIEFVNNNPKEGS